MAGSHGRRPRSGATTATLIALVGLTSVAVGSVATWLVPPYLALMAWLVFAPARPEADLDPGPEQDEEEAATSATVEAAQRSQRTTQFTSAAAATATDGPAPLGLLGAGTAATATIDPPAPPAEADATAKPRRARGGRGRGKAKAAAATTEAVAVTWVRVGPGQFVRVETPVTDADGAGSDALTVSDPEVGERLVDVPTEPLAGHRRRVVPDAPARPEVAGWRLPDLAHGPYPGHPGSTSQASAADPFPVVEPIAVLPPSEPEPATLMAEVEPVAEAMAAAAEPTDFEVSVAGPTGDLDPIAEVAEAGSDPDLVDAPEDDAVAELVSAPPAVLAVADETPEEPEPIVVPLLAPAALMAVVAEPEPVVIREDEDTVLPQAGTETDPFEPTEVAPAAVVVADEPIADPEFDEEALRARAAADVPTDVVVECDPVVDEEPEPLAAEPAPEPAFVPDPVAMIRPLLGSDLTPGDLRAAAASEWVVEGPPVGPGRSLRRWLARCASVRPDLLVEGVVPTRGRRPRGHRSLPTRRPRRSPGQLPRGAWRFASRAPPDPKGRDLSLHPRRPPGVAEGPNRGNRCSHAGPGDLR